MGKRKALILLLLVYAQIVFAGNQPESSPRIFLIFNQPKYMAGDTVFFRGYLTKDDLTPVVGKRIVNLKLIGANDQIVVYNRVIFENGSCVNQLALPNELSPDVYSLIAYTDEVQSSYLQVPLVVVGEKDFAINREDEIIHESSEPLHVTIDVDKLKYGTRQQVNAQVTVTDANGKPVRTDNIISVVHEDPFKNTPWINFFQQSMKVNSVNDVSQGSSRALNSLKGYPYYFKGRVLVDTLSKAITDSLFITFYFTNNDFIYGVYTDRNGNFEFPLFKEFGDEELFYRLSRKGVQIDKARIKLEQNTPYKVVQPQKMNGEKTDPYFKLARQRKAILNSFNYYRHESKNENSEEADDWMETDFEVSLEKFEPFSDMKEVLINIVPMVKCQNRKNVDDVWVFMKEAAMFTRKDPLYIINGIMTDETKYFLGIDPAQVEKIGVLRSPKTLARFGELGKNGIILVKTKNPLHDLRGERTLSIVGINKAVKFYSPKYDNSNQANSKVPDLRSTLYWNPKISSDTGVAKFSFYTGDATGSFKIRINGIAEGDRFFSGELVFQVRPVE